MRCAAALMLAVFLAACAGAGSSSAPSSPAPGNTVIRGRFIGYKLTPDSTVSILDCKAVRGTERIKKDGSFELSAPGCPPGIHRLVFGKNASGLLKFTIRGPITDIGTIEGDQ